MGILKVWPVNNHSTSFRSVQAITAGMDCANLWHLLVLKEMFYMFPNNMWEPGGQDKVFTRIGLVPFSAGETISQW